MKIEKAFALINPYHAIIIKGFSFKRFFIGKVCEGIYSQDNYAKELLKCNPDLSKDFVDDLIQIWEKHYPGRKVNGN